MREPNGWNLQHSLMSQKIGNSPEYRQGSLSAECPLREGECRGRKHRSGLERVIASVLAFTTRGGLTARGAETMCCHVLEMRAITGSGYPGTLPLVRILFLYDSCGFPCSRWPSHPRAPMTPGIMQPAHGTRREMPGKAELWTGLFKKELPIAGDFPGDEGSCRAWPFTGQNKQDRRFHPRGEGGRDRVRIAGAGLWLIPHSRVFSRSPHPLQGLNRFIPTSLRPRNIPPLSSGYETGGSQ